MGTNATSKGSKITLDQLNALYQRLSTITNTHKTSAYQQNASAIPDMKSSSGLTVGSKVTTTPLSELKQGLQNLSKSKWFLSNTNNNDTLVSMTDYGSSIVIPSVGELIEASDFNLIETAITSAESIIPNYSGKYNGQYSGQYSGQYGGQYNNRYSSQYGTQYNTQYVTQYNGQYTQDYRSDYLFQYATDYRSDYTFQYATDYRSDYTLQYVTQYSGQYSRQYRSRYSTCYSTCYSGRYGSDYGSRYSGQYSGQSRGGYSSCFSRV